VHCGGFANAARSAGPKIASVSLRKGNRRSRRKQKMRLSQRCVKYFSIDFIHYSVAANPCNKRGRLPRGHWARGDCSAAGSQEVHTLVVRGGARCIGKRVTGHAMCKQSAEAMRAREPWCQRDQRAPHGRARQNAPGRSVAVHDDGACRCDRGNHVAIRPATLRVASGRARTPDRSADAVRTQGGIHARSAAAKGLELSSPRGTAD
jgi:hypothetical protein